MNKIQISENKTLKLTNVLIAEADLAKAPEMDLIVTKMDNYLKSKGAMPLGPVIQKVHYDVREDGAVDLKVYFLRQANTFIRHTEAPYQMESVLRVPNCIYAHFTGPEDKLKLAYDKIGVTAFEEDILLTNDSYTIFLDKQGEDLTADVFMEKQADE